MKALMISVAAVMILGAPASADLRVLPLRFATHIAAGMAEVDVFVEDEANPGQVVRLEGYEIKGAAMLARPLYAGGGTTSLRDGRKGPYAKGTALGFSLGNWLGARATGTYTIDGNTGTIAFTARRLVPNGLYTLWCLADKLGACGAADGTENTFRADADGRAATRVRVSANPAIAIIALAYHSDGRTYGASPGIFGVNSHVHLFIRLPQR